MQTETGVIIGEISFGKIDNFSVW